MKTLTFPTNRQPTPERKRAAVEAGKRKAEEKRFLRSVKYCQLNGCEVYPDKEGIYPFHKIFDKKKGIELLVCDKCFRNYYNNEHA